MSGEHKVGLLCEALMVSRSGYYDWRRRRTYGSPRIAHDLGCPGGHNRIARLMRQDNLQARQRSKYRVATTDSRHAGMIAPHRLMEVKTTQTNEAWVTDVTHTVADPIVIAHPFPVILGPVITDHGKIREALNK